MNSSLIGKVEKAHRYADERSRRIEFDGFAVRVHGDNGEHEVRLDKDIWSCNCDFFQSRQVCSHTMAIERVLDGMLSREARATIDQRVGQPA